MASQNLYKYNTPKSGNEETGFFNIKGRITRKSYFLRLLFSLVLYGISAIFLFNGLYGESDSRTFIFFETLHFYVHPFLLGSFNLIQGIKRMHDVNKSGWYFLFPLYNLYLILLPGTRGNNDYGIDPVPQQNIQFFDEFKSHSDTSSGGSTVPVQARVAPSTTQHRAPAAAASRRGRRVLLLVAVLIAVGFYYFGYYEPAHRDSDRDGVIDKRDECPYEYGSLRGCPDSDSDGISDSQDACPNDYGIADGKLNGCPDSDADGIADKDDACPDKKGNDTDGCFYYKQVTFTNNSSGSTSLSIAYYHAGEWICEGWYDIAPGGSYTYNLPFHFKTSKVYWYANASDGGEWSGSSRYFSVVYGGTTGFKSVDNRFEYDGGGRAEQEGFYELSLTDVVTYRGFRD
jgi:uncharacterized membrane protein YhaH (DUF805 family)